MEDFALHSSLLSTSEPIHVTLSRCAGNHDEWVLRQFDLAAKYGPCTNISRKERLVLDQPFMSADTVPCRRCRTGLVPSMAVDGLQVGARQPLGT